jgi:hypothetical protein
MWFDVVENITKSKTCVVVLDDGQGVNGVQNHTFISELKKFNIHDSIVLSLKSSAGSKLAESYGLNRTSSVLLLRANKELAWMWQGRSLPGVNDVVYRFCQVGH